MYGVLITGVALWLAVGFIAAVCLYSLSDRELSVGDVLVASAGLSTAGPFLLFILFAAAISSCFDVPSDDDWLLTAEEIEEAFAHLQAGGN